jgi:putative CocE/NonD family hydrolase
MRDGTQIACDVMLPSDLPPSTRLPVIMIMARYWRSLELRVPAPPNQALIGPREPIADYLIPRGFAMVVVDARGTGASTGVSRYPWAPEEIADYGEIVTWTVSQPWCNGSFGAIGISYEGATAQRLISTGAAGIKGVVPQEIEFDVYPDIALPGGIFNQAFIKVWSESNKRLDSNKPSSLFSWIGRILTKGVRPVDSDRDSRALLAQALQDHQANTDVFQAVSRLTYRDDLFGDTGATLDDLHVPPHRRD